jgi:hypothetical protein
MSASHELHVGGFTVNNQIDVRLAGNSRDARFCSCLDLSLPRRDARTRNHQNKSGGSLRWFVRANASEGRT